MNSTTPAICELSQFGLLNVAGTDAQSFLHNQLSCDVAALTAARSTYGSYCTPKGRVVATFLLWRWRDGYVMQLPSSLLEPIRKQLSKFILRSKVKLEDAAGAWLKFGVAGADADAFMEKTFGRVPQGVHEVLHLPDLMLLKLPSDRYEIVASQHKGPEIMEALAGRGPAADPESWDWLEIRAGVPVILPATQGEFVPQMVNLDLIGGVSYEKGCYPGQEIVARMHYRGTLKQRMYLANTTGAERPQPGETIYSPGFGEQACGAIVNAARSPGGGHDVLAVIQIAAARHGDLHLRSLTGPALELLQLPYSVT